MADQWHDDNIIGAQVRNDEDDAPDDWEAVLEEKPKKSDVEEKSNTATAVKAPGTTKNKASKKKFADEEDSPKIVQQPEGNFTPEELDEMQTKEELNKEQDKLDMVSELVDKNGERQSLDNLNLINRDEFLNYSLRLSNHLDIVSKSEFYPEFIDHFLNGITASISTEGVKRLASTLQVITLRKQSEEKEKKAKAKTKKQAKPQLKTIRRTDYGAFGAEGDAELDREGDYDDEDFM